MPQGTTAARASLADRATQPANNVAASNTGSGGQVLCFYLRFAGLQAKPEDVFDALITKYGAGKVALDNDASGHGNFSLVITP
jgi:hypothetical protein